MDPVRRPLCAGGDSVRCARLSSESASPCERTLLTVAQRHSKLWGLKSRETIVPLGGDVCRRVPGWSWERGTRVDV